MNKDGRQQALKNLLARGRFKSQDAVVKALKKLGFHATQASISRDFKELGVVREAGHYRLAQAPERAPLLRGIGDMIQDVTPVGANLMVVKTNPGAANVIAAHLDSLEIPGKAGTIAGDDTIFVATQNEAAQARAIQGLLKN